MTALAFAFSTTASAQGDDTIRFEIEAQRLSDALLDFSRQSRINVIAPTSLTQGFRSTAVSGELTPQAALVALIGGAAIEVRPQANGSIMLERTAANEPAADVEDVSDRQTSADPIQEQIVVTGSFIKRDSFSDIGSPVDVVDREMIDSFAPTGQLNDFLRFFPQNIGDYNFVLSDLASSTRFGGGEIDLRGLGGGSTLVLLNGRRQTRFAFVTWINSYDITELPGAPVIDGVGQDNFANIGASIARWRGNVRLFWNRGRHSANTTLRFYSEIERVFAGITDTAQAEAIVDAQYSYNFENAGLTASIGALNLLNNEPNALVNSDGSFFVNPTQDPRGRMLYVNVKWTM